MPFEWSKVGIGPAADEFEVTVFGPGFGECLVIHVGNGRWVIVDSCVDASDRTDTRPVAEKYLRKIGVDLKNQVDLIVASHWHDDHVRGLSRLVEICPMATFSCANALLQDEFLTFVESMATGSAATNGAKVKEIRQVLNLATDPSRPAIRFANGGRLIRAWPSLEGVEINALSPSDREYQIFLSAIGNLLPQQGQAKRAASRQTPNLASVVLHVKSPIFSVLLGADMEIHHDPSRGWTAAIQEANNKGLSKSCIFKVAHHGSQNGHHDQLWAELLTYKPISIITPYSRLPANKKLPTVTDLARISSLSSRTFSTAQISSSSIKGRSTGIVRGLRDSGIITRSLASTIGMVRLRKSPLKTEWDIDIISPALEH